jgi:hypothetical protein
MLPARADTQHQRGGSTLTDSHLQQFGGAPARRSDTATAEQPRPLVAGPPNRGDGLTNACGRATKPATAPTTRPCVDLGPRPSLATRLQRRRPCRRVRWQVVHWA